MNMQKLIDGLRNHRNGAASYESVDEAIRVFEAMQDVDGEKVCKGFECCYMDKSPKHCEGCPYNMDNEGCGHDTFALERDALSLIRQQRARIAELEAEQEPIPPVVEQEMDDVCSCIDDVYRCGKCGCRLYRFAEKNKYCPDCGKAVRWDATD